MIRRIQALNYRCLRYVDVRLDRFHILVGPNASGKSTLLDVVSFLSDLGRYGLVSAMEERTQNFQDLVWNRSEQDMEFELALEFDIPPIRSRRFYRARGLSRLRYEIRITEDEDGLRIDSERAAFVPELARLSHHRKTDFFPEAASSPRTIFGRRGETVFRRSRAGVAVFNPEPHKESPKSQTTLIRRRFPRFQPALEYLSLLVKDFPVSSYIEDRISSSVKTLFLDSQKIRQPSPPRFRRRKFSSNGWSLPWLVMQLQQKHRTEYAEWLSHVQTMLSDLEGIRIVEREEDRNAYLMLKYKTGVEVPSWMVSDGTLRFLAITLIPYLPYAEQIYLLEEPENGVHPLALDAIYDSLSSAYDSQVFVATHSPAFLKLAEPNEVLCFAKDEQGATDIVRGDRHPILKDWQGTVDIEALFATGVIS